MTAQPSAAGHRSMRKVAIASMTGTVVEFYDFFIFSTAAVTVFNVLFYPELGPAAGTLLALSSAGVAFVARPLGAIIFGHFGDRLGRKRVLVVSMLLMGFSTVAVGLMPTAATIGVAAPIALIVLRIAQGLAVGGEWAGAILLATESAPSNRRGFYALYPQLGPSLGFALSTATFLITSLTMSEEAFLSWGWRLPFLLSAVLIAVGLYVRLSLEETPVFQQSTRSKGLPVVEVFRHRAREVVLGAGAATAVLAFFGMAATFMISYGTAQVGLPRTEVLLAGLCGGLFFALATVGGAYWSDRVGRRRVVLTAAGAAIVVGLALFPIVDIGTTFTFGLGLALAFGVTGLGYGPLGAQLAEIFPPQYRYTGAGVAYNIAGILGAAATPVVATPILNNIGSTAVGVLLALIATASLLCVVALPETRDESTSPTDSGVIAQDGGRFNAGG